jgi:hypothetical protein
MRERDGEGEMRRLERERERTYRTSGRLETVAGVGRLGSLNCRERGREREAFGGGGRVYGEGH